MMKNILTLLCIGRCGTTVPHSDKHNGDEHNEADEEHDPLR